MDQVKFDEQELSELFQVEELEKRYEMGWLKSIDFDYEENPDGSKSFSSTFVFN
ncbi:MAG: hypothetical protein LBT25_05490 [Candidatus Symbiothrix sp.]|jgi:hypothetical protein|nr:hypothetical protein [Candidatus Symbiothrix sp.]